MKYKISYTKQQELRQFARAIKKKTDLPCSMMYMSIGRPTKVHFHKEAFEYVRDFIYSKQSYDENELTFNVEVKEECIKISP